MIRPELIDYAKCQEYAGDACFAYGIPECDRQDIGSDAFLLAIRRGWHAVPDGDEEALANRIMYTCVLDVIRRRNTQARRILTESVAIDASDAGRAGGPSPAASSAAMQCPGDDDEPDRGIVVSDAGAGAAAIRRTVPTSPHDDWEHPFWLRLFDSERQKLRRESRRSPLAASATAVIRQLLKDSRLCVAQTKCRLPRRIFDKAVKLTRERFELCFAALTEWRNQQK